MKKALLVISFGTSYAETCRKNIRACEQRLAEAFPDRDLFSAFTSEMIIAKLARSGADLKGVVSVHGGLETPAGQDYKEVKGQLLVQHGSADEAVSLGQFAALVAELESAGVKHEATSYSGAPHAFSVFGSDNYRADADAKSWQRFTGFLKEVTGS